MGLGTVQRSLGVFTEGYTHFRFRGLFKSMRREVLKALGSDCARLLPQVVVDIILDYAYDIRCGTCSVQYFFWLSDISTPSNKCRRNTELVRRSGQGRRLRRDTG